VVVRALVRLLLDDVNIHVWRFQKKSVNSVEKKVSPEAAGR
jgi:hypothetical protein